MCLPFFCSGDKHMSARRFKAPKPADATKLAEVNAELLDELAKLLPKDNPAVVKRKKLIDTD
jgi:hypothetical protein